ncbi:Solute carrier family 35 [Ceratobasidium sp. AG-Ba]|nr:Solute carrier family 35 [Ceratobasidium sp. AG-Ba]
MSSKHVDEPVQPPIQRVDSAGSVSKSAYIDDRDNGNLKNDDAPVADAAPKETRPPLDYSSLGAFGSSLAARFRSILTRRFILSLLGGQLVSICITCTSVTTTELVNRNWALPTTQTFFLYFSLFVVYTPYTIYQYGFKGWGNVILKDGWKYFILAACDVEGNFLVVKAYEYTNLLSCMLLDAWAIPACAFFAWLYMRPKYHWTQLVGILICVGGMGMLVASDRLTGTGQYPAASMVKGDLFMLAGATLYGFTNATEEFLVRKRPLYEVVGQLGMYGMIINAIQASGLEHEGMRTANWSGAVIGLLFAYTAAMFILYTTAPLIYRAASSVYYNLSLLSSDFYGLLFGLGLYHYRPYWLYFVAFAVIISGLVAYFWHSTPEEQGTLDPKAPEYVSARTERQDVPV